MSVFAGTLSPVAHFNKVFQITLFFFWDKYARGDIYYCSSILNAHKGKRPCGFLLLIRPQSSWVRTSVLALRTVTGGLEWLTLVSTPSARPSPVLACQAQLWHLSKAAPMSSFEGSWLTSWKSTFLASDTGSLTPLYTWFFLWFEECVYFIFLTTYCI